MASVRLSVLALLLVACSGSSSNNTPDAGSAGDGSTDPDAALCQPACGTEANADVACTVFATCESICNAGFARCGGTCVTESAAQCGAGCEACPAPSNGSPTCSQGVCGVACNPGYVECEGYSGPSCCPYASDVVAPVELGGYMPSIAIDAQGNVNVAYYGSAEHELVFAKQTAAGIVRESARWYWSSGGGAQFQLALGTQGPLILYTYPNSRSGLFLAERRTGGWSHSTLSTTTPAGFGFVTDRGGRAHACFTDSAGGISYAIRKGDQWTITSLGDTEAKGACAIAVDHDGLPHIAYYRNAAGDLVYAKGSAAGAFATAVVDTAGTVGSELAIAVAADGTPQIAAYRSDTQDLRWAAGTNGAWSVQDVSSGRIGSAPHIAIGGNGLPVITYWDQDLYRIVIAVRETNQTWTESVFDDVNGGAAALATAPDGSIWAATGDGDVLAYHQSGGSWWLYPIDELHRAGGNVTLLHSAAQPAVVYTQSGSDSVEHVEVATRQNGAWRYTELATAGTSPVATVDGANHVHVAYQTGSSISYATDAGGSFAIEPVASAASDASIAVDAASTPYIAYVANPATSSYALMLAVRGATGWTTSTLGAAAPYGTYQRPVVRVVGGVVHVLWYDGVAKSIVYASSTDGYTKVTLEASAEAGHDLYVAPGGTPHACYFRRYSSGWPDLRYATRSGTGWSSVLVSPPGSAVNDSVCAIRGDAAGTIAIARSLRYGAGLGELVLTKLGATNVNTLLQDDFYSAGLGISVGPTDFEVAATGRPYNGSGFDQNRVRWAHK